MGIICCGFCVMLAVLALFINKKYYAPAFLFSAIFAIVSFVSLLQLEGSKIYIDLSMVDMTTYLMVMLGVLAFFVGCNLKTLVVKRNKARSKGNYKYVLNKNVLIVYLALAFIGVYLKSFSSIRLLIQGRTVADIYQMNIEMAYGLKTELSKSGFENLYITYIGNTAITLLIPVMLAGFFFHQNKLCLVFAVVLEVCEVISSGGRVSALVFLFYIIMFLILSKKGKANVNIKKYKKVYAVIIIVAVVFVIYVFNSRSTDIVYTIIAYLGYPLLHMQERLVSIEHTGRTYGFYSLLGFLQGIFGVLNQFGFDNPNLLDHAQNYLYLTESAMILKNGARYNAFITCFFPFYCDFGWLGVAGCSLVFGNICQTVYRKFLFFKDEKNCIRLVMLTGYGILLSFVRFQFVRSSYAYAFILLHFLYKKVSNSSLVEENDA